MQLWPIRVRPSRGGIAGRARPLPCLTKAGAKELPGHAGHSSNRGTSTTGVRALPRHTAACLFRVHHPDRRAHRAARGDDPQPYPRRPRQQRDHPDHGQAVGWRRYHPLRDRAGRGRLCARTAGTTGQGSLARDRDSPHARRRAHVSGQCAAGPAAEIRHHPRRRWPLVCGRYNRRGRSCQAPSGGEPAGACHRRGPAPARAKPDRPGPRTAALNADAFRPVIFQAVFRWPWPAQRPPL
jgi:hypothetical protein